MNNEQEKINTTPDEVAKLEAEFADKRRSRVRRTRIIRAVTVSVLAIVLIAIVYLAIHYRDKLDPESLRRYVNISSASTLNTLGGAADVVGGNSAVYAAFSDGLAVATTTSVRYAPPDGRRGFSQDLVMAEPALYVNGEYLLAYDRSGTSLMLLDDNGLISSGETDGKIISASVSGKGVVSVISEDDGYISCLTVFSRKFELIYRWHNSEYYCISSAYHDDSQRCGVTAVSEQGGDLVGRVLIFDVTSEGIAHSVDLGLTVPTELWSSEYGFTAATRSGAAFVDTTGSLYANRSFTDPVYGVCTDGKGGLFVLLAPYTPEEKYVLVRIDSAGTMSRRVAVNDDILAIHGSNGFVALLNGKNVSVYNTALDIERIISTEPDIINIAVIKGELVVLFSEDGLTVS